MDFSVQILGPFALSCDGSPVDTGRLQRRPASLLRLLAASPGLHLPREQVIETLWPDADVEAGASNLRYTLHLIRRFLEVDPPAVVASAGSVALNPEHRWTVDLDRFDELARRAGDDMSLLEEAVGLRRAEPLSEDRYEEWAVPIRDRVERTWRDLSLRLARLQHAAGNEEEAVRRLEAALESDPYDEALLQELLRTMGDLGRRAEALRRFDQFERRLQSELDVPVSPETAAVASALKTQIERRAEVPPAPATETLPALSLEPSYRLQIVGPFVGRQAELDMVVDALPGHAGAGDRLVMLEAEAGMGKSRILAEVTERARREGMLTLAGCCYEGEGRLPFGPIHDALLDYLRALPDEAITAHLSDLMPDLTRIVPEIRVRAGVQVEPLWNEGEDQRLRLFTAVAETLSRAGQTQPVVLLLDDLQWADESTVQLLHFLVRQAGGERLLILGAYRPDEASSAVHRFAAEMEQSGWARTVTVTALQEGEMRSFLMYRLQDACSAALARALAERSHGNPFFAGQMLRLLQQEGRLSRGSDGWDLATGDRIELPAAVRDTIARRVERLGPDERRVLALGAVLGREFPYAALEAAWQTDPNALFDALDAALVARLLEETESGYAFLHPILREAIYETTPLHRRKALHGRAGAALQALYGARAPEHGAELAWHFLQSGESDKAIAYALLAGDSAEAAFAHDEAELHYARALELVRGAGDRLGEAEILEKVGATRGISGRYAEALESLEGAAQIYLQSGDLEAEGRVVARIGEVHVRRETEREGLERLAPVLERMEAAGPSPALAELYITQSRLVFVAGQYEEQLRAAERAVQVAREVGADLLLPAALLAWSGGLGNLGRSEAIDVILEVLPLAEAAGDNEILFRARRYAGVALQTRGGLERGAEHFERALSLAERMHDPAAIARIHLDLAGNSFVAGRWSETRRHIDGALAATRLSGPVALRAMALDWCVLLCVAEGDIDGGLRAAEEYVRITEGWNNPYANLTAHTLMATVALAQGDAATALTRLEPLRDAPMVDKHMRFLLALAEARSLTGHHDGGLEAADEAVALTDAYDLWPHSLDSRWIRAAVLARAGRHEEAESAFEAALEEARELHAPYTEGLTLLEWGLLLEARGEKDAARECLEAARAIFETLGAKPDSERAAQALSPGRPMPSEPRDLAAEP